MPKDGSCALQRCAVSYKGYFIEFVESRMTYISLDELGITSRRVSMAVVIIGRVSSTDIQDQCCF